METFLVILVIYIVSTLIPISIYFLTRKHQQPSIAYLIVMLVFSFLVDGFGLASWYWLGGMGKGINAINSAYGCLEIVSVVMLYQAQLSPGRKLPFVLVAGLLMAIQGAEMFIFRGATEFAGTSRAIFAIVVTAFALFFFFKLLRNLPATHVYHIPMFWINIGMLVYFTGNFFWFVIQNYLAEVMTKNLAFHQSFHNVLGICAYVLFSIGLWQGRWSGEQMIKADVSPTNYPGSP